MVVMEGKHEQIHFSPLLFRTTLAVFLCKRNSGAKRHHPENEGLVNGGGDKKIGWASGVLGRNPVLL